MIKYRKFSKTNRAVIDANCMIKEISVNWINTNEMK